MKKKFLFQTKKKTNKEKDTIIYDGGFIQLGCYRPLPSLWPSRGRKLGLSFISGIIIDKTFSPGTCRNIFSLYILCLDNRIEGEGNLQKRRVGIG